MSLQDDDSRKAISAGRIATERAPDNGLMHTALTGALARAGLSGVNYPGKRIASDESVTGLPH